MFKLFEQDEICLKVCEICLTLLVHQKGISRPMMGNILGLFPPIEPT